LAVAFVLRGLRKQKERKTKNPTECWSDVVTRCRRRVVSSSSSSFSAVFTGALLETISSLALGYVKSTPGSRRATASSLAFLLLLLLFKEMMPNYNKQLDR
jgi:hypothetical protein